MHIEKILNRPITKFYDTSRFYGLLPFITNKILYREQKLL